MQTILANEASRLDIFLAKALNSSRSQVAQLIKNSLVMVNGVVQTNGSFKLSLNDEIKLEKPKPKVLKPEFEADFDIEILFEDDDILVLNKPSNLVVHKASSVKTATLVDWLVARNYTLSSLGGMERAGLVHRLDKDTSGAIIIAKNNAAHAFLAQQLADKTMGRVYLALIDKPLKNDKMIVEKALIRSPKNPLKKVVVDEKERGFINKFGKKISLNEGLSNSGALRGAKWAKSAFVNLGFNDDFALVAAKLFTGRTHQIRAHLASLNRHILGDLLYGFKPNLSKIAVASLAKRVMLHAYFIYFKHPKTKEFVFVKAPLMSDFKELLNQIEKGKLNEISLEYLSGLFGDFS